MALITNIGVVNTVVMDNYGKVYDLMPGGSATISDRAVSDSIYSGVEKGWLKLENFPGSASSSPSPTPVGSTVNALESTQLLVKSALDCINDCVAKETTLVEVKDSIDALLTKEELAATKVVVHVDNFPNPQTIEFPETQAVSGPLTNTELRAAPVVVTVDNFPASAESANIQFPAVQAVSGPLTDAELRAAAVPTTVTNFPAFPATQAVSGPLTNTELRATPVPTTVANFPAFPATQVVSGPLTNAELRATAVPTTVSNFPPFPTTQAVSGPLTNAELRASALPTSVSNFPATQAVSGPLTNTELRATPVPTAVQGEVTVNVNNFPLVQTVAGPITDSQLRATAVPVKPFAPATSDWTYTGIITNTTSTAMKAGTANTTNYLTGFQYQSNNAVVTSITILNGTTAIWQGHAPANMVAPASIVFQTPLRAATGAALNIQCGTTNAKIFVNAQGYQI